MQGMLPLSTGLLYECANSDCFYVGVLLRMTDVIWKDYYDHREGDLLPLAACPSCVEPMMIWNEDENEKT